MINLNSLVVGSRLHVTKERLNKEINRVHEHVLNLLNNPTTKLHEKHNAFAAYTALCVAYATGHRPVYDIFCFTEDLFLDQNFMIVNDKVTSDATKNRICWFSDNAKNQLKRYRQH